MICRAARQAVVPADILYELLLRAGPLSYTYGSGIRRIIFIIEGAGAIVAACHNDLVAILESDLLCAGGFIRLLHGGFLLDLYIGLERVYM